MGSADRFKTPRAAIVFWIALLPAWLLGSAQPWPHEQSRLEPDPAIVWGALDNGVRYALMPRDSKPGAVSMRLVVGVGSLDEAEHERGIAHFIEHMAFEGSRHFEPGSLTAFFERLGMRFGGDVNAFTHHDKTVYHLELPTNDASLLRQSLILFRDYADGLLMPEDRIEVQKEVIARERAARETPGAKVAQAATRFTFAGTLLADRDPIGLESVVASATRQQLIEFYQKWYRPDLMTLVAVGDFDPAELEARIEEAFRSMEAPGSKLPQRRLGRLSRARAFRSTALEAPGFERNVLKVSRAWMEPRVTDSWEARRADLTRAFATELLDERFRRAVSGVGEQFARYERVFGIPYGQLSISAGAELGEGSFVWVDRLLRQAIEHGFLEGELETLRSRWRQSARADASWHSSAEPREVIDRLVTQIAEGRVSLAPAARRHFVEAFLEGLDLETVHAALKDVWRLRNLSYFVAGEIERPVTRRGLRKLLRQDRRFHAAAYDGGDLNPIEYTQLGPAGTVREVRELPEVSARTYRFSNNVRLTFLHTKNEEDTVRSLVRVGAGLLAFEGVNPATHALALPSVFRSAFGSRQVEDVYSALRSNVFSFEFGLEDHDAFSYRAVTSSDGLEDFLRIVAEYVMDPRVDDAAFALSQLKLRQARDAEADGLSEGYRSLRRLLYPGQPRFHAPTLAEIAAASAVEARQWVDSQFREGALEVIVVGDADEERVVTLVSETLGALPARLQGRDAYAEVRSRPLSSETGKRRIEYGKGKGDGAASVVVWPVQESVSTRERAGLYLLASVLENRIREKVRGQMGASYSQSVTYVSHAAYERLGYVRADVDCSSDAAETVIDAILALADDLRERPIGADELQRAASPLEASMRLAWRDNSYLLDRVLAPSFERPDAAREAAALRDGLVMSIEPRELRALARKFLQPDTALSVAIVPELEVDVAARPQGPDAIRPAAATEGR